MTASWRDWQQQLEVVLRHVDWAVLGQVYFHDGGEARLRARQTALLEHGEQWARAANKRLLRGGRSLWVGAGLGDLPAMLAEVLLLERRVVATNLRSRECRSLNASLHKVNFEAIEIVCRDAGEVAEAEPGYDHLAAVGLFTDPETFPQLSGVGYGRIPPVQLDVAAFTAERDAARGLLQRLWRGLQRPALITTTGEEAPWYLEQAASAGVAIEADETALPSAIIGDPIGFLRVP